MPCRQRKGGSNFASHQAKSENRLNVADKKAANLEQAILKMQVKIKGEKYE